MENKRTLPAPRTFMKLKLISPPKPRKEKEQSLVSKPGKPQLCTCDGFTGCGSPSERPGNWSGFCDIHYNKCLDAGLLLRYYNQQ